jgi:hypothetical protein
MHPKTNACWPVFSQFGAGRDCGRGPVDSVDHNRLCRIAGADRGDSLLQTHWCHSRECHERLPPSPALSRSMAGLKKRLFLYGPAHRAQMLAKAQGGRVLALRKVGVELYLGA